jgi:hypothetical protein
MILSTVVTQQPPAVDTLAEPPIGQDDLSKKRGSPVLIGQLDPSGDLAYAKERREQRLDREQRRELAKRDLHQRAETQPAPWETPSEPESPPTLFPLDDPSSPGQSHHFSAD